MNSTENTPKEEEIINPEQFQVGRTPQEDKEQDDEGYTSEEIPFADGEGTELDENIELDEDDELEADVPESDEDFDDEDADFENPEDDPA